MAKPQNFLLRPRYLRAIPSLVVLTTAMAWGVVAEPVVRNTASRKACTAQIHDVGGQIQNPAHVRPISFPPAD